MRKYKKVSIPGGLVPVDSGLPQKWLIGFGDSRTAQGWSSATSPTSPMSRSDLWWAETLSRQVRVTDRYNQAVGGYTARLIWELIANRTPNAYGYAPQDIPESSVCRLLALTNDVSLASTKADIDTALGYYERIVDWILREGHKLIVVAEAPRDSLSATQNQWLCYIAEKLRRYRSEPDVYVVDIWPETADPTATDSRPLSGLLTDGLHFSHGLAYLMGKKVAGALEQMGLPVLPLAPTSNGDLYDATNNPVGCLNLNPYLDGDAGTLGTNASGTVPSSYTLVSNSASIPVVGSKVTVVVDGITRTAWRGVISAGTGADGREFYLQAGSLQTMCQPGDVLEAGMEFIVGPGHNNIEAPRVRLWRGTTANSPFGGLGSSVHVTINPNHVEGFSGVVRSPRVTVSATTTIAFRCGIAVAAPSVTSSVTLDVLSCWVRKV